MCLCSEKQNKEKKEKINFWTDNLEQFKKHVKKQMPGTRDQDIQQQYGIPMDMDYVE
jgi:hypothetical protein